MNITVIGLGYVGLTNSVVLASFFHNVIGLDIDKLKVASLKQGIPTIKEPNLDSLLAESKDRLRFTTNAKDAIRPNKVIFIAVDTPENEDGSCNLTNFYSVLDDIAMHAIQDTYVVIRSTVPVGTNRLAKQYLEKRSEYKFHIISNPEFLTQGKAIINMITPSRLILGIDDKASQELMLSIYEDYEKRKVPTLIVSPESAELIKYASNNFLAIKISYINEIARLCTKIGANVEEVAYGMGLDPRIGHSFLKAGVGYGGSCFPKDTKALSWFADSKEEPLELVKAAIKVNSSQPKILLSLIQARFANASSLNVAVLGLSFKGNTEDVRNSPAFFIVQELLNRNARVRVFDPRALDNFKKVMSRHAKLEYCENIEDALHNADCAVILNDAKEFKELKKEFFIDLLKKPIVFDGRNLYRLADMQGVEYYSIGRPATK